MKNITTSEFIELQKRIWFEAQKTQPEITRPQIFNLLIEYETIFDGGCADFLAFIKYADKMGMDIMPTIGHDLNGRNDRCFLPRTDGYFEDSQTEERIAEGMRGEQ